MVRTLLDSQKSSSQSSRQSLMPTTMPWSLPGFDVYSSFPYVSAAFLPICILFSLHRALAKLIGAKLSQRAVCLLVFHLSSGCQLQFWSQLSFILHSCITSGINWSLWFSFPPPLSFQSNILAAAFSHHLFWLQITLKLFYSRLTCMAGMQLH